MAVAVTVLASGSRGNCTVIASNGTRILVDAGLSCRETFKRLQAVGEDPRALSGIIISHEHSDHVNGLPGLIKKLKVPVYMTGATRHAWKRSLRDSGVKCEPEKFEEFSSGHSFSIGDVNITPFTVPHDAADPVGFTFRAQGVKIALVTDLGYMPASVRQHIRGCDALILESNHDLEMLRGGPYPWVVKQRVMSRVGHLSNEALAEFFSNDYDGSAAFVVLAHLSEQNNHPEVARAAAEVALAPRRTLLHNRVMLASQATPLDTIRF
ncbi:MAG TPA: MBL fold metallo-hydrolase [Terriglobales bacterium]|nr:MBL fold metallo-hydrolase [Terriglobales bacterium]